MNSGQVIESATKANMGIPEFITTYGGTHTQETIDDLAELISSVSVQRIVDHYKNSADIYAKQAYEKNNPHKEGQIAMARAAIEEAARWAIATP